MVNRHSHALGDELIRIKPLDCKTLSQCNTIEYNMFKKEAFCNDKDSEYICPR